MTDSAVPTSAWTPLQSPLFRAFWIASLFSNLGTWVHEVGAGWLMSELDSTPEMVASVRTAMSIPIVLLAIPAGVLADRFDRRRLLISTQLILLMTAMAISLMTYSVWIAPWSLLLLTFAMGLGLVVHVPAWQASIPELVPREQLPQAVALGSISFNLARAFGPACGGLLIAQFGVWIAFAINALSFGAVLVALVVWKRQSYESPRGLSFSASLIQGIRYVYRRDAIRRVMIGVTLFIVPASAFWSLLPLVARKRLGWGADGFGLLVGAFGVGAVLAAWLMPLIKRRWGAERTVLAAMSVFAACFAISSVMDRGDVIVLMTIVMGGCWMTTLTTLNASAQVRLPNRMRARGMSCYLTAIALSMAIGSTLWGQVAGWLGIGGAQFVAAAALIACVLLSVRLRLGRTLT